MPERRVKVDQARDRMIAELVRISAEFEDSSPEKPELMFQLAELYWEKERYLYDLEMARNDRAWKTYEAATRRGEKARQPVADHRESARYRRLSMEIYRRILAKYPHYGRNDQVLFLLAYDLSEIGQRAKAARRYAQLVREHPRSEFAPDAWIQLGNHQFRHHLLGPARHSYQQALASPVTRVHAYALYRLAWCDLDSGKLDSALARLKKVVRLAETKRHATTDLRNEALKDMVQIFVRLDRVDEARAYFAKNAPKGLRETLVAALGDGLAGAGRCANAVQTYRALLAASPEGDSAPEYQEAILRCEAKLSRPAQVRKEAEVLAKRYGPGGPWWKAHAKDDDTLQRAFDTAEEGLRILATGTHQEAQKTHEVRTWKLARDLYGSYLEAFARSADPRWVSDQAFDLAFYDAEVLWTLKDWADAAAQYERVVRFPIPNRASARAAAHPAYRERAAYDAILAYDELVKIERGEEDAPDLTGVRKVRATAGPDDLDSPAKKPPTDGSERTTPAPLTRWEHALVDACDTYARRFPDGQEQIEVQYLAAVVLYGKGHLRDAAKRFRAIVARWPKEKRSEQAAELALHVYEVEKDWKSLSATARAFLDEKGFAPKGSALGRRFEAVLAGSRYKAIGDRARANGSTASAEDFLAFARRFPTAAEAPRALTWAMILFEQHHALAQGIAAGEQVLRQYPRTPLRLEVDDTLGRLYGQAGDFRDSAERYERFLDDYRKAAARWPKERRKKAHRQDAAASDRNEPKRGFSPEEKAKLLAEAEPWVPDAELNAALWWESLGQLDRALTDYRRYLSGFGKRSDGPKVAFHIGVLLEGAQRWRAADRWFARLERRHDGAFASPSVHYRATYHRMLDAEALHWASSVKRIDAKLIRRWAHLPSSVRADPEAVDAYAHARLIATEPLWKRFRALRLNRVRALRRDLRAKQRALEALERACTQVIAVGSAQYGMTALTRIGLAYADFASAIRSSPVPPGVPPSEVKTYRQGLEKLAAPLDQKATQVLEKALAKGSELYLYGPWTEAAQAALARNAPNRFGPPRTLAVEPGISWRPLDVHASGPSAAPSPVGELR